MVRIKFFICLCRFYLQMESEDLNLAPFFVWNSVEGEDHIPKLLLNELESQSNVNLATDARVPGRIKGQRFGAPILQQKAK